MDVDVKVENCRSRSTRLRFEYSASVLHFEFVPARIDVTVIARPVFLFKWGR